MKSLYDSFIDIRTCLKGRLPKSKFKAQTEVWTMFIATTGRRNPSSEVGN